jgi:hypothetical protein
MYAATEPLECGDDAPLVLVAEIDPYADWKYTPTWTRPEFHPGEAAQLGLDALVRGDRAEAQRRADLLEAHMDADGYIRYAFAWDSGRWHMEAGWPSGFAQGLALSLFTRLGMREAAARVHATLQPGSEVARREGDDFWIEEYPLSPPNPVLNGAIFGLFGLYDYGDRALFLEGVNTVRRWLPSLRRPGGFPAYDLAHWSIADGGYPEVYRWQFETLARMTGDRCFASAARLFTLDAGR